MKSLLLILALVAAPAFAGFTPFPDHLIRAVHEPNLATKATITVAGSTGKYHVLRRVHASEATDATAQTPVGIQVKDGSTVVATWALSAPANSGWVMNLGEQDLEIRTTTGNALTVEFTAAGVANSSQRIAIGYVTKAQ